MTQTFQIHYVFNTITHGQENSSAAEDDTSEVENVTDIDIYGDWEAKCTRKQTPSYQL